MKSITKRRLKTRSIGRNTINRQHKRRHSNRRWNAKQDKSRKKRMIGGAPPPGSPRPQAPEGLSNVPRHIRSTPTTPPPHPPPSPSTGWDCDCKKSDKPQTQTSTQPHRIATIGVTRDNITFTSNGIKLKKKLISNTLPQELNGVVIANVDGYQLANEFLKAKDDNEKWKIIKPMIERREYESGNVLKLKKIVPDTAGGYSSKPNYEDVWIPIMPESLWKNNWREKPVLDKIKFINRAEQQNNTNMLRDIGLFELNNSTQTHDAGVMDVIKRVLDDKGMSVEDDEEWDEDVNTTTTTTTQVICDCSKPTIAPEPSETVLREVDV